MTLLSFLHERDAGNHWSNVRGGALAIGNFDGVHRGHRQLLAEVRRAADTADGPAIAIVFDPHPSAILRPHSTPPRLTTVERRAELMSALGIDHLLVCQTSIDFLNRTADEFFDFLMVQRLKPRAIVEGPNFFFGRDRGGDVHVLGSLCDQHDIRLKIVQPHTDGSRMVSSSRIRESISSGDVETANSMLGSIYRTSGTVAHGDGRGKTLGFPTANLEQLDAMAPGHGVYAAIAHLENGASPAAAVHVGPNPTFDERTATKIEVHALNTTGDLYGQTVGVDWIAKIRDVVKFGGLDELKTQLARDLAEVRRRVAIYRTPPNL